jgi:hypothetical protein
MVQLLSNVNVDGSLVFGSTTTGANSYTPTSASTITNNGNQGLIQTFNGSTDYELYVSNPSVNAVEGYPSLVISGSPANSYIQNRGTIGAGTGGFSRAVNTTGAYSSSNKYVFPLGTATHGFNGVSLAFTSLSSTKVRGMFVNGPIGSAVGYVTQMCSGCSNQYPAPDNNGLNIIFGNSGTTNAAWPNNPCDPGHQQWVVLEDGILSHGYWSFTGTSSNDQYVIEAFPNGFTELGNSTDTWRTMIYGGSTSMSFDPTNQSWNSGLWNPIDPYDILRYTRNANSGCYSGTGVPGGTYKGYGHFAMKKAFSSNALPVEMVNLSAEAVNNTFIRVAWSTDLEINNRGFVVERSTDGNNFDSIGWVNGHGNSTVINDYSFDDLKVAPEVVYYYRLKQIDYNSHSAYTGMVSAEITGTEQFLVSEFIPNPSHDLSKIIISTSTQQAVEVNLYNSIGQLISRQSVQLSVGENSIDFKVGVLASSAYSAIINCGNKVYTRKLIVTGG